jgi:hypothetical protein
MAAPKEKRHLAAWSGFTLLASLVRKANGTASRLVVPSLCKEP